MMQLMLWSFFLFFFLLGGFHSQYYFTFFFRGERPFFIHKEFIVIVNNGGSSASVYVCSRIPEFRYEGWLGNLPMIAQLILSQFPFSHSPLSQACGWRTWVTIMLIELFLPLPLLGHIASGNFIFLISKVDIALLPCFTMWS